MFIHFHSFNSPFIDRLLLNFQPYARFPARSFEQDTRPRETVPSVDLSHLKGLISRPNERSNGNATKLDFIAE